MAAAALRLLHGQSRFTPDHVNSETMASTMKTNSYHLRRHLRHRRRGTIYLLVLFSCLIVATISLSSLQLMRLQGRSVSSSADFSTAQAYARAAIEIGMLKIRNDPYWRTNLGNGNWLTDQPIGVGTLTLSAADPVDNDIRTGDNHPVMLTGTGMKGEARYCVSMRMEVGPRVGSCLEVSMATGNNLSINGSTLTSDQSISANNDVIASGGSTVNANVEAFNLISGANYAQARQTGARKKTMPDLQHVMDYYIAQGTAISYTALPKSVMTELIQNTSFESNTANWYAKTSCSLQISSKESFNGSKSLRITQRSTTADVAAQDLPIQNFKSSHTYHLSVPVNYNGIAEARGILILQSTGDGVQTFMTPAYPLNGIGNTFVNLQGDITPTWSGILTKATVTILINAKKNYSMDGVSLIDVTYPANSYVIDNRLMSPTVNAFGATNAKGIYIINCDGQDVMIGYSRIVGTLVFLNPGINSKITGSVCWEAAVYNFPALLTNRELTISTNSTGLSEANCGINLNPAGTPWPFVGGISNTTNTDSYPTTITGIVYSAAKLNLAGSPRIKGVVVADNNITVTSSSLSLNYGNTYLNDPPPGFTSGTITMKVVPGTWQRSVN